MWTHVVIVAVDINIFVDVTLCCSSANASGILRESQVNSGHWSRTPLIFEPNWTLLWNQSICETPLQTTALPLEWQLVDVKSARLVQMRRFHSKCEGFTVLLTKRPTPRPPSFFTRPGNQSLELTCDSLRTEQTILMIYDTKKIALFFEWQLSLVSRLSQKWMPRQNSEMLHNSNN